MPPEVRRKMLTRSIDRDYKKCRSNQDKSPTQTAQGKERKFYQALLIALNAEGPDIRLRKVAEMLVKQALKGEAWAIKELADQDRWQSASGANHSRR